MENRYLHPCDLKRVFLPAMSRRRVALWRYFWAGFILGVLFVYGLILLVYPYLPARHG
jgi:hypothetical protein